VAKPTEAQGTVARVRAYLDTRRVQRFAVPALIVVALVVVASIFFSHKSEQPVTEIVPEVAPAAPTGPTHATLNINSDPPGAEVMRMSDSRQLGTTPLVDIRPADGRIVTYRFHLAGHTDVQMPFQVAAPGKYEISATLTPIERHSEPGGRAASPSGRHGGRGKDKKHEIATAAPSTPVATPGQAPVAQPRDSLPPSALPPLGERNPVRRLGR
jgi:hypothetical protein